MSIKLRGINLGYMGCDLEMQVFPHPDTTLRRDKHEGAKAWCHSPVLSYIIEHPQGRILFDTGVSPEWATEWDEGWQYMADLREVTPETCLLARLRELGLGPDDFDYLVLGHLHADHAGGARTFKDAGAEVVVHRDEYDWVTRNVSSAQAFYIRRDWEHLTDVTPTLVDADDELLADVRFVSVPGHTEGTMGLMIRLERTGWVILSSDALFRHENYGPPALGAPIVHDATKWARSVEKIRKLAAEHDAWVFPGHGEIGIRHDGEKSVLEPLHFHPFEPGYSYE